MKLTKKKAIKLHREMWKRISEMSDEEIEECKYSIGIIKYKIIKEMGYDPSDINTYCFCCEYSKNKHCLRCPIKWPGGFCYSNSSPYYKYIKGINYYNYDINKLRQLSKEISELPERK